MSKRLLLFLSVVLLVGTVELVWYLTVVRPNLPAHRRARAAVSSLD